MLQNLTAEVLNFTQENLTNEIIQSLTHPLTEGEGGCSPLERYALINQTAKAAAEAAKELSDAAIEFALNPDNGIQELAGTGKQFSFAGFKYQIQFNSKYNYNQNDDNGRQYASVVQEIEDCETRKKALTQLKNGLEAVILADHPRLQPTETAVILKYIGPDPNVVISQ